VSQQGEIVRLSVRLRELIEARQGQPAAVPNVAPPTNRKPTTQPSDFAWVRSLREGHEGWFRADFWTRLESMPAGPRIRHLRRVLGWTQQRIADELGVSLRTVIRHERGQQHRANSKLLCRLSVLERDHENQLLTYF
jgi:DNA-binding XRE family transcriptional regulator